MVCRGEMRKLKTMLEIYTDIEKQGVGAQAKSGQNSEKSISFAELIDDCIKLVQMPNRVDVYGAGDYIEVRPFDEPTEVIFDISKFNGDNYLIKFSLEAFYFTREFGEADRVKKLYNLCLDKAEETQARHLQKCLARNRANLTKAAQSVKQYM